MKQYNFRNSNYKGKKKKIYARLELFITFFIYRADQHNINAVQLSQKTEKYVR